jgi:hypothetical protein
MSHLPPGSVLSPYSMSFSVAGTHIFFCLTSKLQWTQNNSELQLLHWKRGMDDGKSRGEQDGKESVWACIVRLKTFFPPFNFNIIGDIFIHNCEAKKLQNTSNASTCLNPHALLLQLKHNNFTSDSMQGRTGLSLRMCYRFAVFPIHPSVFWTVIQLYVRPVVCARCTDAEL